MVINVPLESDRLSRVIEILLLGTCLDKILQNSVADAYLHIVMIKYIEPAARVFE